MTEKLRRQWKIWQMSLVLYLLLLGIAHVASASRVTVLTLQPHVEARLNVFSVLGHDIYFDLEFSRNAAKGNDDAVRSRELGGIRRTGNGGMLMLPGQPVLVEVALDDGPAMLLAATPANRVTPYIVNRSLRADGVVLAGFTPLDERDGISKLTAHPGLNHLTIRVVQVGSTLLGEDVELIARAPMRAAGPQPGYGFFVTVFLMLPVAVVVFFVWSVVLHMRGIAERRRAKG